MPNFKQITAFKLFHTACLLILSFNCFSQVRKIDSLNRLISLSASDTQRVNYMNVKVRVLSEVNIDSAIELSLKIINEAESIGYSKGAGDALGVLARNYGIKGMYNEALHCLQKSERIFEKLNDSIGLVTVYKYYGIYYNTRGIYDSGIIYYERAIPIGERHSQNELLKDCYNNIGIAYQMQSNFSYALSYFQKGLRVAEKDKDINTQAYLLLNMGITLLALNDYPAAEKNLLKTIELAKKDGATIVELYAYSNIASVYSSMQKFELAHSYAINSAELAEKMGDNGMVVSNMSRAATQLAKMGKFKEADELGKKAVLLSANTPDFNLQQVNVDMGAINTIQRRWREAIPFFEKAFAIMKNNLPYDPSTADAYAQLSLCYEKTGDYKKSLEAYKTSTAISDSVKSRENIRKATELRMNYDFETKQKITKAEQDKKEAEAKRLRNLQYFAIGIFLLLAVFLYINSRQKTKAKAKIEKAYGKLKSTQAQLIHSEKMASLGELTAGIAHEIQNPLNFVNNFSEVSNELIDEMKEELAKGNNEDAVAIAEDVKQNLEKILNHGKRADAIVKGMLQHSRTSSGQRELTDINVLADEYLRLAYHGLKAKDKSFNAKFETDFDPTIEKINVVPQEIGRVILNLINNAFYAVSEKKKAPQPPEGGALNEPTVTVSTRKTIDKILISVKDNGIGVPKKVLDKIFQPFFTTKPTGQGTGLGLSLAYDIVKAHGGELKIDTKEGEGSEFTIVLS